mmetsp:Transcript_27719/g.49152  ORF Transcript_27719/g.49152 Transcript_27719/m.49152 type:complete len:126 (+) Transcript_27719:85-462(+)
MQALPCNLLHLHSIAPARDAHAHGTPPIRVNSMERAIPTALQQVARVLEEHSVETAAAPQRVHALGMMNTSASWMDSAGGTPHQQAAQVPEESGVTLLRLRRHLLLRRHPLLRLHQAHPAMLPAT